MSFLAGVRNEHFSIRTTRLPGILREACGFSYQEYSSITSSVALRDNQLKVESQDNKVSEFMEFLMPEKCNVLAFYDHPHWSKYAAITQNNFGKGSVTYIAAFPSIPLLEAVYLNVLKKADLITPNQSLHFPIITKQGINKFRKQVHYYFNYSNKIQQFIYPYKEGISLIDNKEVAYNQQFNLNPWDLIIIEEK